jgi:ABC-type lipoprotein release transport system permease subunit
MTTAHSLLFCSFGIFSGLHNDFYQQITHHRPHIVLRPVSGFFQADELEKIKTDDPDITAIAPVLVSQGVLSFRDSLFTGVLIRGLKAEIPPGRIRISKGLAKELEAEAGDQITLVVADGSHHDLFLDGFFADYGFPDLKQTIEMELGFAQEIITGDSFINQLEIRLPNLKKTDEIRRKIADIYPDWRMESWKTIYAETIKLFRVEKILHFCIFLIMLIFSFVSINCAFMLLFLRREKSLVTLLKLGLPVTRFRISVLIAIHALVIICLTASSILSLSLKKYLQTYPVELPASLFYSAHLPFLWDWNFWLFTASFIYLAALLAFFLPARKIIQLSN